MFAAIFERVMRFLIPEERDLHAELLDALEAQPVSIYSYSTHSAHSVAQRRSGASRSSRGHRSVKSHGSSSLKSGLSPKQKQRLRETTKARMDEPVDDSRHIHSGSGTKETSKSGRKKERSRKRRGGRRFGVWVSKASSASSRDTAPGANSKSSTKRNVGVQAMPFIPEEEELSAAAPSPNTRPKRIYHQYAYEWFHLVRRMVMEEGRRDYKLGYACPPLSLVYMVHNGWIDLASALAWKHSRHLLGTGLVELSAVFNGLERLRHSTSVDVERPSEQIAGEFQRGWPKSVDIATRYDWRKDEDDRAKHGPFGGEMARYATPEVLEEVLETLLSEVNAEEVMLPGNLGPLFVPLLTRRRETLEMRTAESGGTPRPSCPEETRNVREETRGSGQSEQQRRTTVHNEEEEEWKTFEAQVDEGMLSVRSSNYGGDSNASAMRVEESQYPPPSSNPHAGTVAPQHTSPTDAVIATRNAILPVHPSLCDVPMDDVQVLTYPLTNTSDPSSVSVSVSMSIDVPVDMQTQTGDRRSFSSPAGPVPSSNTSPFDAEKRSKLQQGQGQGQGEASRPRRPRQGEHGRQQRQQRGKRGGGLPEPPPLDPLVGALSGLGRPNFG